MFGGGRVKGRVKSDSGLFVSSKFTLTSVSCQHQARQGTVVLNPSLIQQHRVLSWAINSVHERFTTVWNLKRPWQSFNCRTICIKSHADMKKGQTWLKTECFKPSNETFERGSCVCIRSRSFQLVSYMSDFWMPGIDKHKRDWADEVLHLFFRFSSLCFAVPPLSSH